MSFTYLQMLHANISVFPLVFEQITIIAFMSNVFIYITLYYFVLNHHGWIDKFQTIHRLIMTLSPRLLKEDDNLTHEIHHYRRSLKMIYDCLESAVRVKLLCYWKGPPWPVPPTGKVIQDDNIVLAATSQRVDLDYTYWFSQPNPTMDKTKVCLATKP